MNKNESFSECFRCQDLIPRDYCLVCNQSIDICKRCLEMLIQEYFISSSYSSPQQIHLEWIHLLKKVNFIPSFCKRCIQTGLYLIPEIDFNRIIPLRIHYLIKKNSKIN